MRFGGKIALVTGASRGIGREIARAIDAEGARVGLVARSRDGLEQTRHLLKNDALIFCADLSDGSAIKKLAQSVQESFGSIDMLVNAAGAWHNGETTYQGPKVHETPPKRINEVIDVGLKASFLLTSLLLPGMISRGSGKILQISCGFAGPHEARGWLHYYVTNKALEAFTQGLASELRQFEIQVNCIAPWFVATEAVQRFYPDESRRALDTREVAKLATFLLSAEADNISGQVIELRSKLDFG